MSSRGSPDPRLAAKICPSFPSSSLGTHLSWKLCFPASASERRARAWSALAKQSFEDSGMTKQELGHEETSPNRG